LLGVIFHPLGGRTDKYTRQALFSVRHPNPDPINTNPNHNHNPRTCRRKISHSRSNCPSL